MGTRDLPKGGVILGFDVCFCLFVAVCSAVAVVCVYAYALHALCTCCTW